MLTQDILPANIRAVFKYIPDLYIILDPDLRILMASDLYLQAIGIQSTDLEGKHLLEAFPCADTPYQKETMTRLIASLQQVLSSKKPQQMGVQRYDIPEPQSGMRILKERYWASSNTPVLGPDGEVLYILHKVSEVTEHVRSQKQIQRLRELASLRRKAEENERQLRLITDAVPALITYLDCEEKFRFANRPHEVWFNQAPGTLLGRTVCEVVGEKTYREIKPYIDRGLAGERLEFEYRLTTPQNIVKHIHTCLIPDVRNKEVVGFFALTNDISKQVAAQKILEQSTNYFQQLANSVPAILWLTQTDGNCTYLNRQWYDYTGQPEGEGLAMGWLQAVHPEDRQTTEELFIRTQDTHSPFKATYRLKSQDGCYCWVVDVGQPMFSENGTYEGMVGTIFNIHDRKIAEDSLKEISVQLAKANEELRKANNEVQTKNTELAARNEQLSYINADLDNFIYTASHDLRAPISNMEGILDALRRNLEEDIAQKPILSKLFVLSNSAVLRFKKTLEELSHISQVQRHNPDENRDRIDLPALIEEIKLDLLSQIEEAAAHIELKAGPCPPIRFSAKNARCIVYNLLSNALKYRSPKRPLSIDIRCYPEGEYQVLAVADNGLGMDMRKENKIFGMFKRLHDHVEGTGVGLYIVKKIIENAGGRIEVESEPDRGSTFRVFFKRTLEESKSFHHEENAKNTVDR